jgi:hypothetical protein
VNTESLVIIVAGVIVAALCGLIAESLVGSPAGLVAFLVVLLLVVLAVLR